MRLWRDGAGRGSCGRFTFNSVTLGLVKNHDSDDCNVCNARALETSAGLIESEILSHGTAHAKDGMQCKTTRKRDRVK